MHRQSSDSVIPNSIVVNQLSHSYGKSVNALNNINLEIGHGIFGLLGSNGAGKSTLMRIICTIIEPTQGQVTICGHDVVKERHKVRELIGYLPQEFGAWRLQKVEEVLDTLASLSGLNDKKFRQQRIETVLESVGLSEVAGRKVKQLSGGMLRRLGVAQALVHDPKILVMDEPTVGLDPEERQRFRQLMTSLGRDRTILLSTHIVADLGTSCSNMALIQSGELDFYGAPSQLIEMAKGKVFKVMLAPSSAQEIEMSDNYEIVSRSFNEGRNVLRGVSKNGIAPAGSIEAENVTLEEAYLAFTLDQARSRITKEDDSELLAAV